MEQLESEPREIIEKSSVLPNYGPLQHYDMAIQKKISSKLLKTLRKEMPKFIEQGLTLEELKLTIRDYQLPHSVIFEFQHCKNIHHQKKKTKFYKFFSYLIFWLKD